VPSHFNCTLPTFRWKLLPPSLGLKRSTRADSWKIGKGRGGNVTPNEPAGATENCLILHLTGMGIYIYCMVMNNVILFEEKK
jgi:hypothetical protein